MLPRTVEHLDGEDSPPCALVTTAGDKTAGCRLQLDGAAVHEVCPQLVQLRHLPRPQEHLDAPATYILREDSSRLKILMTTMIITKNNDDDNNNDNNNNHNSVNK
jgi:hypothetical protein